MMQMKLWPLIGALILTISLILALPAPALALNVGGYFDLNYTASLSRTAVSGTTPFSLQVSAVATCTKDLPVSVSSVTITGHVEAQGNGASVPLDSSYTVTIDNFPNKAGESCSKSQSVNLQFPAGAQSGVYTIEGKLDSAQAQVGIMPIPVPGGFLPSSQTFGTVNYTGDTSSGDNGGNGGGNNPVPTTTSTPTTTPSTPEQTTNPTSTPSMPVQTITPAPTLSVPNSPVPEPSSPTAATQSPIAKSGQPVVTAPTTSSRPPASAAPQPPALSPATNPAGAPSSPSAAGQPVLSPLSWIYLGIIIVLAVLILVLVWVLWFRRKSR